MVDSLPTWLFPYTPIEICGRQGVHFLPGTGRCLPLALGNFPWETVPGSFRKGSYVRALRSGCGSVCFALSVLPQMCVGTAREPSRSPLACPSTAHPSTIGHQTHGAGHALSQLDKNLRCHLLWDGVVIWTGRCLRQHRPQGIPLWWGSTVATPMPCEGG